MKKVYLTVDVGSNWLGEIWTAREYIDKLADLEVDAVKVQVYHPTQVYTDEELKKLNSQFPGLPGIGMSWDDAAATRDAARSAGIDWYASVFDVADVERLVKLGPKFIKIAARNAAHLGIVQMAAQQSIPTIISVSAQYRSMPKRGDYMGFFGSRAKYKLLYCVSRYPTEPKDVSIFAFRSFDGFSDHTVGIGIPIVAAYVGLESHDEFYIEVHGIMDGQNPKMSPDGVCSKTFSQIRKLVGALREVEAAS